MKIKEPKAKAEAPFDPVLFAATAPARKPTAKDIQDTKAHEEDLFSSLIRCPPRR